MDRVKFSLPEKPVHGKSLHGAFSVPSRPHWRGESAHSETPALHTSTHKLRGTKKRSAEAKLHRV